MWLENDVLKVLFDERRGGMLIGDSFGFIEATSIEIARTKPIVIFDRGVARLKFPFFQSLNDAAPSIRRGDSWLVSSGVMRRDDEITPHTYEMVATLEGNRLSLAYKLNVARKERIAQSKIWLFANPKLLQKCMVSGRVIDEDIGRDPRWDILYDGEQPKAPITLFGSGGRLEVTGSTTPPVYAIVCRFKGPPDNERERGKLEVIYGWARDEPLKKGIYLGNLTLVYG